MALSDLKKRGQNRSSQQLADQFISGASARADGTASASDQKPVRKTTKSYLFSLTEEMSEEVTRLSRVHPTKRVTRSDIIRLGVLTVSKMSDDELIALIEKEIS